MKKHFHSVSRRKFVVTAATTAIAAPFIINCSTASTQARNSIMPVLESEEWDGEISRNSKRIRMFRSLPSAMSMPII